MKKLITLLAILFSTIVIVKADHEIFDFYEEQVTMLCSTNILVNKFLNKEGLIAKSLSVGKENEDENAVLVFLITQYENLEKSKSAATVQLPNTDEVCILYYAFNLKF